MSLSLDELGRAVLKAQEKIPRRITSIAAWTSALSINLPQLSLPPDPRDPQIYAHSQVCSQQVRGLWLAAVR